MARTKCAEKEKERKKETASNGKGKDHHHESSSEQLYDTHTHTHTNSHCLRVSRKQLDSSRCLSLSLSPSLWQLIHVQVNVLSRSRCLRCALLNVTNCWHVAHDRERGEGESEVAVAQLTSALST